MSLINDMLKDLDARRAQPAGGNMTALPSAGIDDSHYVQRGIVVITVGTVLLLAILTVISADKAPAQVHSRLPGAAAGTEAPITTEVIASAGEDSVSDPAPELFAGRPAPAPVETLVVTTTDASAGAGLPANKPLNTQPQLDITLHKPTSEQQLARDFHTAARAAGMEYDSKAVTLLESILERDSDHHEARLLLARLYIRQQQQSAARLLLTGGLSRHPLQVSYAHLLARLLMAEGHYSEAIKYLQTALAGATQNEDYHALLAGLYQRTGEPEAAVRHYRIALELSPGHGEWWMGLGISQEQAGDSIAAQTAYRQALRLPLKTVLQQYINQRLQQLPASLHESMNKIPGKV